MNSCLICNRPVPDYIPEYCCTGDGCGCRGEPLEPCLVIEDTPVVKAQSPNASPSAAEGGQ
jgi:hypothetical protein